MAAVDTCQRCGAFVCGQCVHIRAEDEFCSDCAAILDRPPSPRPKLAFALAALPLPLALGLTFFAGTLGTMLGLALLLPLIASALALLLQERAARPTGRFYPLAWGMIVLDLLALAALAFFVLRAAAHR